jgi:hypothetical protein
MIVVIALLSGILFLSSCEWGDGSSSDSRSNGSLIEAICEVTGINNVINDADVLKTFNCSNGYRILFTTETTALKQRTSCSGFDNANPNDIDIGNILFVKYYSDEVNWANKPVEIRAVKIDAYRPECISGIPSEEGGDCSLCDFFN